MSRITLYHNSDCSKSRAVFEILKIAKMDFEVIAYLEQIPTEETLDLLLKALRMEPSQLVRVGEDVYENLQLKDHPPSTRQAWLKVLVQNPILIERPIVTDGQTAVIGRPPEKVTEWLNGRG